MRQYCSLSAHDRPPHPASGNCYWYFSGIASHGTLRPLNISTWRTSFLLTPASTYSTDFVRYNLECRSANLEQHLDNNFESQIYCFHLFLRYRNAPAKRNEWRGQLWRHEAIVCQCRISLFIRHEMRNNAAIGGENRANARRAAY